MRVLYATDASAYALAGENFSAGTPAILSTDYGQFPDHPEFRREVTLRYDVPYTGALTVEVSVFWTPANGHEMRHKLVTIINGDLQG